MFLPHFAWLPADFSLCVIMCSKIVFTWQQLFSDVAWVIFVVLRCAWWVLIILTILKVRLASGTSALWCRRHVQPCSLNSDALCPPSIPAKYRPVCEFDCSGNSTHVRNHMVVSCYDGLSSLSMWSRLIHLVKVPVHPYLYREADIPSATFCFLVHPSMDSLVSSTFCLLWVTLLWILVYKYLSYLLSISLEVELLDHMLTLSVCNIFEEFLCHFPQWLHYLHSHFECISFRFLYIFVNSCFLLFW